MKCDLVHVSKNPKQQSEVPDIERWMGMALHGDHFSVECKVNVLGVERLNQRMLRTNEVVHVIALNCLMEERQPQQQHGDDDEKNSKTQSAILLIFSLSSLG